MQAKAKFQHGLMGEAGLQAEMTSLERRVSESVHTAAKRPSTSALTEGGCPRQSIKNTSLVTKEKIKPLRRQSKWMKSQLVSIFLPPYALSRTLSLSPQSSEKYRSVFWLNQRWRVGFWVWGRLRDFSSYEASREQCRGFLRGKTLVIAACFQWLSVSSYLIRPQRDTETRSPVNAPELRVPQEPTSVPVMSESGGKAGNTPREWEGSSENTSVGLRAGVKDRYHILNLLIGRIVEVIECHGL